jgi:hypothetical protein
MALLIQVQWQQELVQKTKVKAAALKLVGLVELNLVGLGKWVDAAPWLWKSKHTKQ